MIRLAWRYLWSSPLTTALNLLLMPSLYGRFGRENRKPRGEEGMAIKGKVVPA